MSQQGQKFQRGQLGFVRRELNIVQQLNILLLILAYVILYCLMSDLHINIIYFDLVIVH